MSQAPLSIHAKSLPKSEWLGMEKMASRCDGVAEYAIARSARDLHGENQRLRPVTTIAKKAGRASHLGNHTVTLIFTEGSRKWHATRGNRRGATGRALLRSGLNRALMRALAL